MQQLKINVCRLSSGQSATRIAFCGCLHTGRILHLVFTPNYSIYHRRINIFIYSNIFIGTKVWNCALVNVSHPSFMSVEDITRDLVWGDVLCRREMFRSEMWYFYGNICYYVSLVPFVLCLFASLYCCHRKNVVRKKFGIFK